MDYGTKKDTLKQRLVSTWEALPTVRGFLNKVLVPAQIVCFDVGFSPDQRFSTQVPQEWLNLQHLPRLQGH